jgi:hypothetical protein
MSSLAAQPLPPSPRLKLGASFLPACGFALAAVGLLYLWLGPRTPPRGFIWVLLGYTAVTYILVLKGRGTFLSAVCRVPLASYLVLLSFALVAWAKLGHFPHYNNPDPKNLELFVGYALASLSTIVGVAATPLAAAALVASLSRITSATARRDGITLGIGGGLWCFEIARAYSLVAWIFD